MTPTGDTPDSSIRDTPDSFIRDTPGERTVTRLALARHGETVWHAENRYAGGHSDIDLTERGRLQAEVLAAWTREYEAEVVVSSPVRRAVETATPSAAAVGVALRVVDELREVDFGVAEGHTLDELAAADPDMVRRFRTDPVAHPFPGSESPADAALRSARALRTIAEQFPGRRVLVVAHNTLLRLGLCALLGVPVKNYRSTFPRLDNAKISEIAISADRHQPVSLLSMNSRLCVSDGPSQPVP
ncbi:histidine phosphatase family protein [Streptomyces sp. cg40]|uniref:histidine phosphatase family protein n=1 Tax=Streptomyces sp. cg40 TaxID=3419764 RepID=UPI003D00FA03